MKPDTVNVPREPTREMVDSGASVCEHVVSRVKIKAAYRAMLAAAPKADCEMEAQEREEKKLRDQMFARVDRLFEVAPKAEPVDPQELLDGYEIGKREEPEAPKVEQEPAAWQVWLINSKGEGHWSDISKDDRQKLEYFRSTGKEMRPLFPPAPASDELLDRIHSWLVCAPMVSDVTEYHEMAAQFVEEIAKHKGSQS